MAIPVLDIDALRRNYCRAASEESHAWAAYKAHEGACDCRARACAEQDRLIAAWRERMREAGTALDRWTAEMDSDGGDG